MERFRARWRESTVDELAAAPVWRARVLDVLLLTTFTLGVVVGVPSVAYAASLSQWEVVIADAIALVAVGVLAFVPSIPYRVRAVSFLGVIYLLGVFLFVAVGPVLAAYFLAVPVLAAVLLGTRAAVIALAVNAVTTGVLGLFSPLEPMVVGDESVGETISWLIVILNFVFVNSVITLSTAALISRLERSLVLNRRLAVAVERSPNGTVLADVTGAIVYLNTAAASLLGPASRRARTMSELLADTRPGLPDVVPHEGWEGSIIVDGSPDGGTRRLLDVEVHRIADQDGEEQQVAVLRDVTEERAMHEAMARSQRLQALGTLVGGTAHDFNNALGSVVGLAEVLRSEVDEPEHRALADDILLATERARGVIAQLMAFGRVRGQTDERTDVGELLERDLALLAALVPPHVMVLVDADPGASVPLSSAELYQVVANLVTNAGHALSADHEGTVHIGLSHEGDTARITVSDDGHGIDPHLLPHVFDPFVTSKPPGEGTGLGLASVHGIVTAVGGTVDIVSSPGTGTVVEILLPIPPDPAPPNATDHDVGSGARASTDHHHPASASPRLLIVDDEELIVSSTSRLLQRRGYEVTECTDPVEAVRSLEGGAEFDVVLTDMSMPTMSGLSLVRAVRAHLPDVVVVVMSGYGEVTDEEDREHLGIDAVIDKPFTVDELDTCLRRAVEAQA